MSKTNLFQDERILLTDAIDARGVYKVIKTISTDPQSPVAYTETWVTVRGKLNAFGAIGHLRGDANKLTWVGDKAYSEHPYEIVVVLDVSPNRDIIRIYNQHIGEKCLNIVSAPDVVEITPAPQVGHNLLLEPSKTREYNILRNITLEKLKWEMNQHII